MSYEKILKRLQDNGLSQSESKNLIMWYQVVAFLLPSNIVLLISETPSLRTLIYLIMIALFCTISITGFIHNNAKNAKKLYKNIRILKPMGIIFILLWITNLILLFVK